MGTIGPHQYPNPQPHPPCHHQFAHCPYLRMLVYSFTSSLSIQLSSSAITHSYTTVIVLSSSTVCKPCSEYFDEHTSCNTLLYSQCLPYYFTCVPSHCYLFRSRRLISTKIWNWCVLYNITRDCNCVQSLHSPVHMSTSDLLIMNWVSMFDDIRYKIGFPIEI